MACEVSNADTNKAAEEKDCPAADLFTGCDAKEYLQEKALRKS
jgi:hypothetical protein